MCKQIRLWAVSAVVAGVCLSAAADARAQNFLGNAARAAVNQFVNGATYGNYYNYGSGGYNYRQNYGRYYGYPAYGYYNGWYSNQGYPAYGYGNGFNGAQGFGIW